MWKDEHRIGSELVTCEYFADGQDYAKKKKKKTNTCRLDFKRIVFLYWVDFCVLNFLHIVHDYDGGISVIS